MPRPMSFPLFDAVENELRARRFRIHTTLSITRVATRPAHCASIDGVQRNQKPDGAALRVRGRRLGLTRGGLAP